ncbi:MAG: sigma-70 family RNA polymerase sigma factor [Melioribacteraceae bacterium]|jgi:RNA polymerase sigma-70 factor (ECF subfamily)|nr:sigma-70 family RNA polymerase sigma factor [Melioribacteraceae bacterium]RJR10092.1 MAG: sigma-70 family RNA polymerase sigma factor [Candidatus Parcubacteria bacterium]WKZ68585.1 MAG: sigma-70 family RNA polymerase sigma factor [Melioribacteraceae bacterium]
MSNLNQDSALPISDDQNEDFQLIRDFIDGNEDAFTKLVLKHKEKVRNLVFLTLGDADNIDDISQDVFINVFHKIKEFRFESKFTTWLYRITVNKCRDYLRKKRVRSIFVPIKDSINEPSIKGHSDSPDLPGLVRKGIEKLPEKLKVPLILRDIEGLSYKEIADQLDCEVGTVKSRIFRARESLKFILEPYQDELIS